MEEGGGRRRGVTSGYGGRWGRRAQRRRLWMKAADVRFQSWVEWPN